MSALSLYFLSNQTPFFSVRLSAYNLYGANIVTKNSLKLIAGIVTTIDSSLGLAGLINLR